MVPAPKGPGDAIQGNGGVPELGGGAGGENVQALVFGELLYQGFRQAVGEIREVITPALVPEVENRHGPDGQTGCFPGLSSGLGREMGLNGSSREAERPQGNYGQQSDLDLGEFLVPLLSVEPPRDDGCEHPAEVENQKNPIEDLRKDAPIDDLAEDTEDHPAGHGVGDHDLNQATFFQFLPG